MKWQATITKVGNGFVVEYWDAESKEKQVYQMKEDNQPEDNKEHIVEMFYDLLEFFAEVGSKHDKKRIQIEWELR